MTKNRLGTLAQRTIDDFGDQWTHFQDNEGYYGSVALLQDTFGPLLDIEEVRGKRVAEIGSGTGRIVDMLLRAGAEHVFALEPSDAFDVLVRNLATHGARVECLRATGEHLPADRQFDLVVSIGVLHHIPDPPPVVRAAYASLRPGGRIVVWLYGHEGNAGYLALVKPLRAVTARLGHGSVLMVARLLTLLVAPYIWLCRWLPLPLHGYFTRVFARMSREKRELIVYDQLRPAYAKYYKRDEALALLESAGFGSVVAARRHGYSWTVAGTK
ncbi:MAG: class I SAM-dependent methyltransferase [Vicinamibacterales bacterium]